MSWAARVDINADGLPVSEQEDDDEDLQKALQVYTSAPYICRCCFLAHPQSLETASCRLLMQKLQGPMWILSQLKSGGTLRLGRSGDAQQHLLHVVVHHAFKVMPSIL